MRWGRFVVETDRAPAFAKLQTLTPGLAHQATTKGPVIPLLKKRIAGTVIHPGGPNVEVNAGDWRPLFASVLYSPILLTI
jgi:hypothetical protein